jgi:hypothetical protein
MTGSVAGRSKKVARNHVQHPAPRIGSELDLVLLDEPVLRVQAETGLL